MALFGEKYGDVVRMVEVGDGTFSRELCGGTHVHNTAEIGLFKVQSEGSSAANMRRIEAITGPEAVGLMRRHDRGLADAAKTLRVPPERVAEEVAELRTRVRELERAERRGATEQAVDVEQLAAAAVERDGALVLVKEVDGLDGKALLDVADRLKNKLGDAAIVLGSSGENRVDLVASVAPALVERGVKAGEIVRLAAAEVGGGGGGRDTLARAGGRDPAGLPRAFEVAMAAIDSALHPST
jgi:alanyl-tRNA synthetase